MKFSPGDIVMVIDPAAPNFGSVGPIRNACRCLLVDVFEHPYYRIIGLAGCFAELALKKIDGERPAVQIEEAIAA
jgi:hypothetical protein